MRKTPVVLVFFLVSAALGAQGTLTLADAYFDQDDYSRAYSRYQDMILGQEALSGEILYRYGYSYEQIRELDATALKIYALAGYYFAREGQENAQHALSTALLEDEAAVLLLEELRDGIDRERRAYLYSRAHYRLFSKLTVFQWKIAASAAMALPFLIGMAVLRRREKKLRA
ncbi:MAG: hypothetical protein LBT39_11545 [Treponema sp.]|jgi:hypothetical protein|nr:hypothetical protein [Treponema sp.]